jgi:hypothetical protein
VSASGVGSLSLASGELLGSFGFSSFFIIFLAFSIDYLATLGIVFGFRLMEAELIFAFDMKVFFF